MRAGLKVAHQHGRCWGHQAFAVEKDGPRSPFFGKMFLKKRGRESPCYKVENGLLASCPCLGLKGGCRPHGCSSQTGILESILDNMPVYFADLTASEDPVAAWLAAQASVRTKRTLSEVPAWHAHRSPLHNQLMLDPSWCHHAASAFGGLLTAMLFTSLI